MSMFAAILRALRLVRIASYAGLICGLSLAVPGDRACAEDWPELPIVPTWLPDEVRVEFEAQADYLGRSADALRERQIRFNAKCGDVVEGSDLHRACLRELQEIEADSAAWIGEVKSLSARVTTAQARRIEYLVALEKRYAALLRRDVDDGKWKAELDAWVKESQDAQESALLASADLVLGDLGVLQSWIADKVEEEAALLRAYKEVRPSADRARAALNAAGSGATTPELRRAVDKLTESILKASEVGDVTEAKEALERLKTVADATLLAGTLVQALPVVGEPLARGDLTGALWKAGGVAWEVLLGYGKGALAKRLVDQGRGTLVRSLGLLEWGVNYGQAALQFKTACEQVNGILGRIDSRSASMALIREKHKQVVNELARVRSAGAQR